MSLPAVISSNLIQTSTQRTWLWVGVIGMALGAIALAGLGRGLGRRAHHAATSFFVCAIAAALYLLMAQDQGHVLVVGSHLTLAPSGLVHSASAKFVYYARYVDWAITTPLLLLGLIGVGLDDAESVRGGSPRTLMGIALGADVAMIVTGLFATLTLNPTHKYTWFAVSCVFFLIVVGVLWGPVRATALATGGVTASLYMRLLLMLSALWFLYPIIWLLGTEGGAVFGLNTETAVYAVVDLTAKVGFGLALVGGLRQLSGTTAPARPVRATSAPASA